MLHSLAAHGISADMVVGSSVGALNGAFYAGDPTLKGVERLGEIWRGLKRQDVFPMSWRTDAEFSVARDFLISHDGIRKLIDDHIPYRICRTPAFGPYRHPDIISGDSIVLSEGSISEADRCLDGNSRRVRADPLQGIIISPMARSPATPRSGSRSRKARNA